MLRFLFLRFLPRRLIPLIAIYEIYRLLRSWQRRPTALATDAAGPGDRRSPGPRASMR